MAAFKVAMLFKNLELCLDIGYICVCIVIRFLNTG